MPRLKFALIAICFVAVLLNASPQASAFANPVNPESGGTVSYDADYFGISTKEVSDRHWLIHHLDQLPKKRVVARSGNGESEEEEEEGKIVTRRAFTREDHEGLALAFHPDDYQTLTKIVRDNFMEDPRTTERMWGFVSEVSVKHPFIFFHQRKAGGSSLRLTLLAATKTINLPHYIVCYDGVDCDMYHIAYKSQAAVYGGHFRWGVQSDLARFGSNDVKSHVRNHFSCATNYRHPIDRIESCLYFRFGAKIKSSEHPEGRACLTELTLKELEEVLYWIDDYGSSCLNEAFRILSGFEEETALDHLMDGPELQQEAQYDENRRRKLPDQHYQHHLRSLRGLIDEPTNGVKGHITQLALSVFNTTLSHAQRCSPLVLEIPESYSAVAHRIPTLGNAGGFVAERKSNVNQHHSECPKASGQHRALIREKAALEMLLYEAVYNITKEKVKEEHNSDYFLRHCLHEQYQLAASNASITGTVKDSVGIISERLPPVIVAMNNLVHHQFKTMLQSILRKPTASLVDVDSLKATCAKSSPPSKQRFSNRYRKPLSPSGPNQDDAANISGHSAAATPLQFPVALIEAGYFKLSGDDMNQFDREFTMSSGAMDQTASCNSKSAKLNGSSNFDRMAILIKDPFVQVYLQAFGSKISTTVDPDTVESLFQSWLKKRQRLKEILDGRLSQSVSSNDSSLLPEHIGNTSTLRRLQSSSLAQHHHTYTYNRPSPTSATAAASVAASQSSYVSASKSTSNTYTYTGSSGSNNVNNGGQGSSSFSVQPQTNNVNQIAANRIRQQYNDRIQLHSQLHSNSKQQQVFHHQYDPSGTSFVSSSSNANSSPNNQNNDNSNSNNLTPLSPGQRPTIPIPRIPSGAVNRRHRPMSSSTTSGSSSLSNSAVSSQTPPPPRPTVSTTPAQASGSRLNSKMKSHEESSYKYYYSLFFTATDYISIFQPDSDISERDLKTKMGKLPSKNDFQFFSYESLIDEAYQHQMKMLLLDYQEADELMTFYKSRIGRIENVSDKSHDMHSKIKDNLLTKTKTDIEQEKVGGNWWKLLVFTQQWSSESTNTHTIAKRLRCAFGSAAHLIDSELVMKILPSVKLFYAEYPDILAELKEVVRGGVEEMGLNVDQMHFMYDTKK